MNISCRHLHKSYRTQVAQRSEEILELPIEELTALIGADELNVKSEDTVWELVLKWIDHDPQSRKRYIVDLMKNIRLGLLDTQFFLENVKDHPYVTGNDACRPIIIETLKFLYDLEIITQKDGEIPTPKIARPRVPHEILFAIGGWSGRNPTNFIETYDTRADRWVKVHVSLLFLISDISQNFLYQLSISISPLLLNIIFQDFENFPKDIRLLQSSKKRIFVPFLHPVTRPDHCAILLHHRKLFSTYCCPLLF